MKYIKIILLIFFSNIIVFNVYSTEEKLYTLTNEYNKAGNLACELYFNQLNVTYIDKYTCRINLNNNVSPKTRYVKYSDTEYLIEINQLYEDISVLEIMNSYNSNWELFILPTSRQIGDVTIFELINYTEMNSLNIKDGNKLIKIDNVFHQKLNNKYNSWLIDKSQIEKMGKEYYKIDGDKINVKLLMVYKNQKWFNLSTKIEVILFLFLTIFIFKNFIKQKI